MKKDPYKLCSYCKRLSAFSYVLSSDDNLIMKVKCKEFRDSGSFRAKDKDDTCIGYISNESIPVTPDFFKQEFIKEDEFSINI